MGVIVDVQEFKCTIPANRFFKAFILDSNNLIPEIVPAIFKSIEFIEGNGEPGSIKLLSYYDGEKVKSMKHRVDEVDESKRIYKFTIVEGENMDRDFESISSLNEFEDDAGGCVFKSTTTYHTKGDDHGYIQQEIKKARDGLTVFFHATEAYLHSNPNQYN